MKTRVTEDIFKIEVEGVEPWRMSCIKSKTCVVTQLVTELMTFFVSSLPRCCNSVSGNLAVANIVMDPARPLTTWI